MVKEKVCQFCNSKENVLEIENLLICQKCSHALFIALKKEAEKAPKRRDYFVSQ